MSNRDGSIHPLQGGLPPGQPSQPCPGDQQTPEGAPYYPPGSSPAPGQPPYQQPPYSNHPPQSPPQVQHQDDQYQYLPHQYPSLPPQTPGPCPQGQPAQYQNQPYLPQQPSQGQYGQSPAQYGQSPNAFPSLCANPQASAPYLRPGLQPWSLSQHIQPAIPGYGYSMLPTPPSAGYDRSQKAFYDPIDTSADVETIREATKGMDCDEATMTRLLASPSYENPWAVAQLVTDYNKRFNRDLVEDIKSETGGHLATALVALVRGPLEHDVRVLIEALDRTSPDEEALMDVLLCRTNADIRAITAEYKRIKGCELIVYIKDNVDDILFRLYSMVLSATRTEDSAPVIPADIHQKVTKLQRATEGTTDADTISVAQIFTSSNTVEIRALSEVYLHKYHRSLEEVIKKAFCGNMVNALLYMLWNANDRATFDAQRLQRSMDAWPRKHRLFINRVVSLYRDPTRLQLAKAAFEHLFPYRTTLHTSIQRNLSGFQDLMLKLIREEDRLESRDHLLFQA